MKDQKDHSSLIKVSGSLFLALLLFIFLLFGMYSVMSSINNLQAGTSGVSLTDWKFIWNSQKESLEAAPTEWRLANSQYPVRKTADEFFGVQYIRLQTTLPANQDERSLELVTANNPIKVLLNGKEIYNNLYDTAVFTGNQINVADIPASNSPATLDVFMRVPFAFSLNARLTSPRSTMTMESLPNQIGLVGSVVIMVAGLLMILLLFIFSVKNKGLSTAIWLSFTILATGLGAVLSQLGLHSTMLTDSWLFKLQLILFMLASLGILYTSVNAVNGWKTAEKIAAAVLFVYTVMFTLLPEANAVWLFMGFPILLIFIAVIVILRIAEAIQNQIPNSQMTGTVFLAAIFCFLYDSLNLVTGWSIVQVDLRYAGLVVYGAVLFGIIARQALNTNVRLDERERQIEKDTRWVEKTISSCAKIFAQQGIPNFCIETAKTIKDLILFDCQNDDQESPLTPLLRIHLAIVNSGQFEEIYTENPAEPCSYERIQLRAEKSDQKTLLFGEHSLDMLLYVGNKLQCILHIDGLKNGLSANLQNMMRSAYTGISAALNSLELKMDFVEMQESVFINLAEIVEQKSTGTGEHLKIVAEMVEVICEELKMPDRERQIVAMASMVHDIGKLAIPEAILCKKGKLNDDEFALMQDHVIYGYNIMSKSPGEFMAAAAIIAQQHHEKYDGTGYLELRGEQIHLYARIVAIADVFDALLSDRSYKQAWTADKATSYINEQSGKHFDPNLVEIFNRCKNRLIAVKKQYT